MNHDISTIGEAFNHFVAHSGDVMAVDLTVQIIVGVIAGFTFMMVYSIWRRG